MEPDFTNRNCNQIWTTFKYDLNLIGKKKGFPVFSCYSKGWSCSWPFIDLMFLIVIGFIYRHKWQGSRSIVHQLKKHKQTWNLIWLGKMSDGQKSETDLALIWLEKEDTVDRYGLQQCDTTLHGKHTHTMYMMIWFVHMLVCYGQVWRIQAFISPVHQHRRHSYSAKHRRKRLWHAWNKTKDTVQSWPWESADSCSAAQVEKVCSH